MTIYSVFEVSMIVVFFILGALFGMFVLHPVFGDIILPSSRDGIHHHPSTENLPPAFCCKQFELSSP